MSFAQKSPSNDASGVGTGGTGGVWTGTGSTTGSVGTGTGGTGGAGVSSGGAGGIGTGGTGGLIGGTGGMFATPFVCPTTQPMDGSTCTGGGRRMPCPYAGDTIECFCRGTGGGMMGMMGMNTPRAWNCDVVPDMDGGV